METPFSPINHISHIDKHCSAEALEDLRGYLTEKMEDIIRESAVVHRELSLECSKQYLLELLRFLRDDRRCQFKMLVDIAGVDWPEREKRFDVVYHLLSLTHNMRVRVKIGVREDGIAPSVTDLFSSANWYEREVFDMFGVKFDGHPDLRRILCDYDFDGFPLRKDFPVEGKIEMYYDEAQQRVAQKPVDLPQEYRHFDWESPWEAVDDPYNLAEKNKENFFESDEFSDVDKIATGAKKVAS